MSTAIDTLLSRSPSICGGRIRIDGTRVTVHQVVTCYQRGLTAEEIVEEYPHINLAQVYAASPTITPIGMRSIANSKRKQPIFFGSLTNPNRSPNE